MFFFFFEQDTLDLIQQSLLGDEILEVGSIHQDYAYDYILPNGCQLLGYPPNTIVDVKKRLVPGLFSILIADAKKTYDTKEFNKFIVIYEEGQIYEDWIPNEINDFLSFISKEQLKEKISANKIEYKQKDWKKDRDLRIMKLRKELSEGQNTLFVGAGLSSSLNVPDWSKLLKLVLGQIRKDNPDYPTYRLIKKESKDSNLLVARFIKDITIRNKKSLITSIRSNLYKKVRPDSDMVDAVIDLLKLNRIGEVITYNYDTLLEQHMSDEEINNTPIDGHNKRVKNAIPVMHVHGVIHPNDTSFDENVVLSEDEYHLLYRDSYHWANVAQLYALTHTTCIFVGLSMTDPSLRRLLDIAYQQGSGDVDHYAFLIRNEFDCHKQTEDIFSKMGVSIIWCDNRGDVPTQIFRVCNI